MGQYHLIVNLDKHEYLHPHRFDDGLKLMEFGMSSEGTMTALALLLAVSNGRGGGDFSAAESPRIGSWGGDRIVIIGDYGEPGDLPEADHAETLYERCESGVDGFTDISDEMVALIEADSPGGRQGGGSLRPDLVVVSVPDDWRAWRDANMPGGE